MVAFSAFVTLFNGHAPVFAYFKLKMVCAVILVMEFDWDLYISFTAAMIAILNPLTKVPFWKPLTKGINNGSLKELAALATGTALLIILVFLLLGQQILSFFSIELNVFKIAGGFLLFFAGLDMVNGNSVNSKKLDEEDGSSDFDIAKSRFRKIFTPMTFPVLSGPGVLTTAILFGNKATHITDFAALSMIVFLILGLIWVFLAFSHKVEDKIDDLGLMIFVRIFGILLTAIAVQFIVEGLGNVFPAWLDGNSVLQGT